MLQKIAFSALVCFTFATEGICLPKDLQVVSGTAEVKKIGLDHLEVRSSHKAILEYSSFDIQSGEKVSFLQDSSKSCVLNRVVGNSPSQIFGSLESNGKVFLVNPNGIYFGPNSQVNVGSLIASTLNISNKDFLEENYQFHATEKSSLIFQQGSVSAEESIVLMAPRIKTEGQLKAKAGHVILASAEHVTLDFSGDGLIQFSVEGALKDSIIEHMGQIQAALVCLNIPTAKQAIEQTLNLEGIQEGEVFVEQDGMIRLVASSSVEAQKVSVEATRLSIEGKLDVSSSLDRGGEVSFFGKEIAFENAIVDASGELGGGSILIGGEYQGKGTTPWSTHVFLDPSSKILANAKKQGDGGVVVLWSKEQTLFDGRIEAKGGLEWGNGGLVETSSQGALGISSGRVDARSVNGKHGNWLLDPATVRISNDSNSCSPTFGSCNSPSCNINVSSITSSTGNVTIQAGPPQGSISGGLISIETDIVMQNPGVGVTFATCAQETSCSVSGNIITKGGSIVFDTPRNDIHISPITIDATGGGSYPAGNTITYNKLASSSSIDSNIYGGTAGLVTIGTLQGQTQTNYKGSITVYSAGSMTTGGIQISSGNINFPESAQIVLTQTSTTIGSGGGSVSIGSLTSSGGNSSLTMKAQGGAISVGGPINGMSSLVFTNANQVSFSDITASSSLTLNIPAVINSSATINVPSVQFNSTVDGPGTLNLTGQSVNFLGAVGSVSPLSSLSVSGGNVTFASSVRTSGSMIISSALALTSNSVSFISTGSSITFGSTVSGTYTITTPVTTVMGYPFSVTGGTSVSFGGNVNTGTISITPPIILTGDMAFNSNANPITFSSSITGPYSFSVENAVSTTFSGNISTNSISISSPTILQASTSNDFSFTANAGNISLGSVQGSTSSGLETLTLNATGSISLGQVGYPNLLSNLTIPTGSSVFLSSGIAINSSNSSLGQIQITPPITLLGDVTLNTLNLGSGGSIALADVFSSLNSSGDSNLYSLTCIAGSQPISVGTLGSSSAELGGIVLSGGALTLTSSIVSQGDFLLYHSGLLNIIANPNGISVGGGFSEQGSGGVSLGQSISATDIYFADDVSLSESVSLTATGSLRLSKLDAETTSSQGVSLSAGSSLISGTDSSIIIGPVGDSSALNYFTITSGVNPSLSNITTSGIAPSISLTTPSVFFSSASRVFSENGSIVFPSVTADGGLELDVGTGTMTISSIVGASTITMGGGSITLGPVTTSGMNAGLTITETAQLILSGTYALSGDFIQKGTGNVFLGGTIEAQNIEFDGPLFLNTNSSLQASGNLILESDLNGTSSGGQSIFLTGILSVDLEAIGASTPLGSVTVYSEIATSLQSIDTLSQSIDVKGTDIFLKGVSGSTITWDTSQGGTVNGASITIKGNIQGQSGDDTFNLLVRATGTSTAGEIRLKSSSIGPLASLTIDGNPLIENSQLRIGDVGISSTSVNSQTVVINPLFALDSDVSFNGATLQILGNAISSEAGNQQLQINASSSVILSQIGNEVFPLGGISLFAGSASTITTMMTAGGAITLEAPSFTLSPTGDNFTYINSAVGGSSGAPIVIQGTLNATTSGIESLQLNATGISSAAQITITDNIGLTNPLGSLVVLGNNLYLTSALELGSVSHAGPIQITIADTIDLHRLCHIYLVNDTVLTSQNGSIDASIVAIDGVSGGGQTLDLEALSGFIYFGPSGFSVPLGSVNVDALLFRPEGFETQAGVITVNAPVQLGSLSTIFDTTAEGSSSAGANITFSSTIDSNQVLSDVFQSLTLKAGSNGLIDVSSDVGGIRKLSDFSISSASVAQIKNVNVENSIQIIPPIELSDSLTTFKASGTGGLVSLGKIDGTAAGIQSVTVSANGSISLGVIGQSIPLQDVNILDGTSATIQSIFTTREISIGMPIILGASSILDTTANGAAGTEMILPSINGTTSGGQTLTIQTGTANSIFIGDIGSTVPIGDFQVLSANIFLENTQVCTQGSQSYEAPTNIFQNIVFQSLGDIIFDSTLDPLPNEIPSITFYPGGGSLVFSDSVGDAPFGAISVFNAGSVYAQDIYASSLRISGGLPWVYLEGTVNLLSGLGVMILDGGPIYLGGEIDARLTWMRSVGSILNLGTPKPLNVQGFRFFDIEYFNAIGGVIGSKESPIEINTDKLLALGASPSVIMQGQPQRETYIPLRFNPPCYVQFNDIVLEDCIKFPPFNARNAFNQLSKYLFYVPGLYSSWSWDNLSSWIYFTQEPWTLAYNPREMPPLVYRKAIYDQTNPYIEDSVLQLQKRLPLQEPEDWELWVEFPETSSDLEISH